MSKATATTVLFTCFLVLTLASYATADSTCQVAERDYRAAVRAAYEAAERDYEAADAIIERDYADRTSPNATDWLAGMRAWGAAVDANLNVLYRAREAGIAAAGEAIPAHCTCVAARHDYKAATTAINHRHNTRMRKTKKRAQSVAVHRDRAAASAAPRKAIPARCTCLAAVAAAYEAMLWTWSKMDNAANERAYAKYSKTLNCSDAERDEREWQARAERKRQAELEQQRTAREAAQTAPDPVRNMAADLESLERSLFLSRDQRALNALGHNAGSADGIFGPRTRKAIKALQRALGVEQTGYLNFELLRQLSDMEQATQTAGTLAPANTCVSDKTLGNTDSIGGKLEKNYDNYSVAVRFINKCAHEAHVSFIHLSGLKYEHERGSPIKCHASRGIVLEPGESDTVYMGPLPRGITQKYGWCAHYFDGDTQKRTGYRTCTAAGQPRCPPIP